MQEFFIDYGLWLLIALLVVIVLVFILSRGKPTGTLPEQPAAPIETPPPAPSVAAPPIVADTASVEAPAPAPEPPLARQEPLSVVTAPVVPDVQLPVSPAVTVPETQGDNLLQLKGVGPKLGALLIDLGITRFAQIAAWTDADIAAIDPKLGNFKGRPVRDQWVDQAKYLAAGDIAGFEAKYGKL